EAEPVTRRRREEMLSQDPDDPSDELHQRVMRLYHSGLPQQAQELALRACEDARRDLGEDHRDVAPTYDVLAPPSQTLGDLAAARTYLERALGIYRDRLGEDHVQVGTSLVNLGVLHHKTGAQGTATTYLERAVAIHRRAASEDQLPLAKSLEI